MNEIGNKNEEGQQAQPQVAKSDAEKQLELKKAELKKKFSTKRNWGNKIIALVFLVVFIILGLVFVPRIIDKVKEVGPSSNKMVAAYIIVGVAAGFVLTCFVLSRIVRTRLRVAKELRDDPDIHDWLVVYNLTQKALYFPTIIAAFLAALLTFLNIVKPEIVGSLFFLIAILNYLVEEYEIGSKVVIITFLGSVCFIVVLFLLQAILSSFEFLASLTLYISPLGYLVIAIVGVVTIAVSWLKGLFYYIAFQPNYMNIQSGISETGEQIDRSDFNTKIDTTSDVIERLMGFGRIIVLFKDQRKPSIVLLVWRIKKKATYLEKVRGKMAIDLK